MPRLNVYEIRVEAKMVEGYVAEAIRITNGDGGDGDLKVGRNWTDGKAEWFIQVQLPAAARGQHRSEHQGVLGAQEVHAIRTYFVTGGGDHFISPYCYSEFLGNDASFLAQFPHARVYDHNCFMAGIQFEDGEHVVYFFIPNNPPSTSISTILGPMAVEEGNKHEEDEEGPETEPL